METVTYDFTTCNFKSVEEAWAMWRQVMEKTYGVVPDGALPNLRQTFHIGLMSGLKMLKDGHEFNVLLAESMNVMTLDNTPKEAMGNA